VRITLIYKGILTKAVKIKNLINLLNEILHSFTRMPFPANFYFVSEILNFYSVVSATRDKIFIVFVIFTLSTESV
jgi:hypothetical protein